MSMTTFPSAKPAGLALAASAVLFLVPALALTTAFGMSLMQLAILIIALGYARRGFLAFYADHSRALRWIMLGFAGFFLVSLGRMFYFRTGLFTLDGPARLLIALSCVGFVGMAKPRVRWFWLGLCIGAIGAGLVAIAETLMHVFTHGSWSPENRAAGFTHHPITFGNLSLAMGLMALCGLSEFGRTGWIFLPVAALLFGLIASVLSVSRGGWVALLFCAFPLLSYRRAIHGKAAVYALVVACVLALAAYLIPATHVANRIAEAGSDLRLYFSQGNVTTNIGIRFDLWKGSWLMFLDHPLIGVGRDQFFQELTVLVQQGKIHLVLDRIFNSSSHNDVLYFLSTGGLLDFSFLLLMYGAPSSLFLSVLRQPDNPQKPAALAGLILVSCFFAFGLTDTMFWLMATKVFYAMMVCILIGFCLAPQEHA